MVRKCQSHPQHTRILYLFQTPSLGAPLVGITGFAVIPPTAAALPIVAVGVPAATALGLAGVGAAVSSMNLSILGCFSDY